MTVPVTWHDVFTNQPDVPSGTPIVPLVTDPNSPRLVVQVFNPWPEGDSFWDIAFWDVDFWDGPGVWQDIGSRVRGLSWRTGSNSPLQQPSVGTANVTIANLDADASPWAVITGGDFTAVSGDSSSQWNWLQPGILMRFGVQYDTLDHPGGSVIATTWLPMFTGTIEQIAESTNANVDAWVDITLVDTTSGLANFTRGPLADAIWEGDSLEARAIHLAADANWQPPVNVVADAIGSGATFQSTDLSANRLTEFQLTAKSVGMQIVGGGDGSINIVPVLSPIVVTDELAFSNKPHGTQLPIVNVTPYASTDRIVNSVTLQRVGGVPQSSIDSLSTNEPWGTIGPSPDATLICESDATVLAVAQQIVAAQAFDSLGISQLDLNIDQAPLRLPLVLAQYASTGLTAQTPLLMEWHHPSGQIWDDAVQIDGMSHAITPVDGHSQMLWTASLLTSRLTATIEFAVWDVTFWDDGTVWAFVP